MTDLARLDAIQRELGAVANPAQAKALYDKIETLSQYAKRYGVDTAKQNEIARAKLDTARKGGEMLSFLDGRTSGRKSLLPDGMSFQQSHRWQRLFGIPEKEYRAELARLEDEGDDAITVADLLRFWRKLNPPPKNVPAFPEGQFPVLYADPPWRYDHVETPDRRAVENQYPTMTVEEIAALGEDMPAADDAVLFLWATNPKLLEALEIADAWGFQYRTNVVWVKHRIGMGYYVRGQHELLLIAKRGELPVPAESDRPPSVIYGPRTEHSAKPVEGYELIERMYPGAPKLELFARERREGWSAWGNEVEQLAA